MIRRGAGDAVGAVGMTGYSGPGWALLPASAWTRRSDRLDADEHVRLGHVAEPNAAAGPVRHGPDTGEDLRAF